MELIAGTSENRLQCEAAAVEYLIDSGFSRVHLRRTQAGRNDMRRLIESIAPDYYPRLSVHDHHDLAKEYGLGGIHLNSRVPDRDPEFGGLVSRSCHSIAEAETADYDYCFLSPVFDSISKSGYRAAFDSQSLRAALSSALASRKVIALGGVSAGHLGELAALGFKGAALLGAIWNGNDLTAIKNNINNIVRACIR